MKRLLGTLLCGILGSLATNLQAQTLIVNPLAEGGFELGNNFAANGWTVVNNSSSGNNWYLTGSPLSSGGFSFAPTGTRAAYISNANNGSWTYSINQYSTTHIYRNVSFPAGQEVIKLKFRWNAYGEGPIYDVLYVYSCPSTLTPTVGVPTGTSNSTSGWAGTGTAQLHATLHSSAISTGNTAEITLPANFAGTNRKLVFTWKNGSTLGYQPPAAIDSIWLYADCPKATVVLQNNSASCTNNINVHANVTNGTANGSYQWYVNNNLVTGSTGANFQSNSVPAGATLRCIYSMNNACAYKDTADLIIQYGSHELKEEFLKLCTAQLPYSWRGIIIPQNAQSNPSFATITVPAPGGCDSTITLNLELQPSPPAKTETIIACRGQLSQLTWRGKSIPSNAHTSSKYDSITVPSPNGCDSLIYLSLRVLDEAEYRANTIKSCGPVVFNGKTYNTSTLVSDTLRSLALCDSVITHTSIVIEPLALELNVSPAGAYLLGETLKLTLAANIDNFEILSWHPQSLFSHQNSSTQTIAGPKDELVYVVGQSISGCVDTAYINLKATEILKDFVMPNAFTPNGDGRNDLFAPVFKPNQNFSVVKFEIYNRWGQLVWASYSGDVSQGWNGNYNNGKPADVGTYYYFIRVKFMDHSTADKKGDLQLIR
jgi:gliding motility-associated-like protein